MTSAFAAIENANVNANANARSPRIDGSIEVRAAGNEGAGRVHGRGMALRAVGELQPGRVRGRRYSMTRAARGGVRAVGPRRLRAAVTPGVATGRAVQRRLR